MRKQKQRGLLTLVVTAKQGVRAVNAAFPGGTYRDPATGLIYRDNENDWFTPIGTIKMPSGPPPTAAATPADQPAESLPSTQETKTMSVATKVASAVRSVAKVVGIPDFEAEQLEKFAKCQALIETKSEVLPALKEASRKLQTAVDAQRAGAAEHDGLQIDYAIMRLQHEYADLSARYAKIQAAEVELVGLCPDASLQRERRQLRESQKQICGAILSLDRRIESEAKEILGLTESVSSLEQDSKHYPRLQGEYAAAQRRLTDATNYRDEMAEEREQLIADRDQLVTDKQELFVRMQAFAV